MAVLSDYRCMAHGVFEAWDAKCPHGCSGGFVEKIFLKPVGMKSDATKHNDKTLNNLAKDYGMTDLKTQRDGESQMDATKRQGNPFAIQWASPTNIGQYNTAPVAGEPNNGLQLAKEGGALSSLRPSVVMKDHENLQIQK